MKTQTTTFPEFSFFKGPITNTIPATNANIKQIHYALTSSYYKKQNEELRRARNNDQKRKAKKKLDFVTFAGTFGLRLKDALIRPSGYCCIDIDHVRPNDMRAIHHALINDPMIETALLFVSPSGTGLKWIIEIDNQYPFDVNYKGVVSYIQNTYPDYFNCKEYNIIDTSGSDISRACFLCYDPEAYINPKYQTNGNN